MAEFAKGQRVQLVYTSDEYTRLRPGALGTVTRVSDNMGHLDIGIKWDDGSTLSMLPEDGDVIKAVNE